MLVKHPQDMANAWFPSSRNVRNVRSVEPHGTDVTDATDGTDGTAICRAVTTERWNHTQYMRPLIFTPYRRIGPVR